MLTLSFNINEFKNCLWRLIIDLLLYLLRFVERKCPVIIILSSSTEYKEKHWLTATRFTVYRVLPVNPFPQIVLNMTNVNNQNSDLLRST